MLHKSILILSLIFLIFSCSDNRVKKTQTQQKSKLFTEIPNAQTQIDFTNQMEENLYFNFLNYPYVYNGGGVAVGDINGDGLEDIYFTSNQNSNKLYLNQGDFKFKDITASAHVKDEKGWSTGVSMIDINKDGWLDIYVCKSGSLQANELRKNKLFINQKDNTFKEEAHKYGLDHNGFSTQAYFLDYDKDGDLDMYLVNHRADFRNNTHIDLINQKRIIPEFTDHLFKNDNGKFVDVTSQAGISNKAWGLSASIGDFNQDGYPDIYVANDFLEPDFLYINNQDGTFSDKILDYFKHISTNSMGCDFADINNDLLPDLMVLEMAPADRARSKQNMASMDVKGFDLMVSSGYHYQYMRNMLQLNNGNNTFSDIGQLAGVTNTDWSWSTLLADFDNDGFKDIFVSNGIKKDLANSDYREKMKSNIKKGIKVSLEEAIAMMPSTKIANYFFVNNKDYTFKNVSEEYGFSKKINSNGTAYADFDNDGDLDLVMNNQGEKATIYRNNSTNNYIRLSLKGSADNPKGIGAKLQVFCEGNKQSQVFYVNRGYQSSVSYKSIFGLGRATKIDSIQIIWNDQKQQVLTDVKVNKEILIDYKNAKTKPREVLKNESFFRVIDPKELGIDYKHHATHFNDYSKQLLLPQKQSTLDNAMQITDVNADGLDDLFLGNTAGYPATLYVQTSEGKFVKTNQKLFEKEKKYNDNNALFFDADADGDLDLYVATGNYSLAEDSPLQQDRLYRNDGKGNFTKTNVLPKIRAVTKAIASYDYDQDGDLDLFIGGRVIPSKYPNPPESYVLENRKGKFVNVTEKIAKELQHIGLVNEMLFSDYDQDGDQDLLVVGEWLPVTFFTNESGVFTKQKTILDTTKGWMQTLKEVDIDQDGDLDYLIGNYGKNNKFHPSKEKPLHIYANHFDDNASWDTALSKVSDGKLYPARGKECSSQQTPFLNEKITTYKEFAQATLIDVYGKEKIDKALHLEVTNFHTFLLKNKGKGVFDIVDLPVEAQFGPTLSFELLDVNKDGKQEIIGVGNTYDAEVETIRYDASRGFILDANLALIPDTNFILDSDTKAIKKIQIKGKWYLIVLSADTTLRLFLLEE